MFVSPICLINAEDYESVRAKGNTLALTFHWAKQPMGLGGTVFFWH